MGILDRLKYMMDGSRPNSHKGIIGYNDVSEGFHMEIQKQLNEIVTYFHDNGDIYDHVDKMIPMNLAVQVLGHYENDDERNISAAMVTDMIKHWKKGNYMNPDDVYFGVVTYPIVNYMKANFSEDDYFESDLRNIFYFMELMLIFIADKYRTKELDSIITSCNTLYGLIEDGSTK